MTVEALDYYHEPDEPWPNTGTRLRLVESVGSLAAEGSETIEPGQPQSAASSGGMVDALRIAPLPVHMSYLQYERFFFFGEYPNMLDNQEF